MYYMGVDVSKHHRDATVIDATGQQVMTPFRFPNTRRGGQYLAGPDPEAGWSAVHGQRA